MNIYNEKIHYVKVLRRWYATVYSLGTRIELVHHWVFVMDKDRGVHFLNSQLWSDTPLDICQGEGSRRHYAPPGFSLKTRRRSVFLYNNNKVLHPLDSREESGTPMDSHEEVGSPLDYCE